MLLPPTEGDGTYTRYPHGYKAAYPSLWKVLVRKYNKINSPARLQGCSERRYYAIVDYFVSSARIPLERRIFPNSLRASS